MTNFIVFPNVDGNHAFPPEVRQAIADAPEVAAKVDSVVNAKVTGLDSKYAGIKTPIPNWVTATVYAAGQQVISPNGDLVSSIATHTSGVSFNPANWKATNTLLLQLAKNPDMLIAGAVTVDANNLVTSAAVVWPDGTPGTLTITSRDSNNAVLGYNVTYGSPVTKTFTQPTITRNAAGAATNVPQIVVT